MNYAHSHVLARLKAYFFFFCFYSGLILKWNKHDRKTRSFKPYLLGLQITISLVLYIHIYTLLISESPYTSLRFSDTRLCSNQFWNYWSVCRILSEQSASSHWIKSFLGNSVRHNMCIMETDHSTVHGGSHTILHHFKGM